jgi:DNA-binding SARP family transcriptional activator
MAKTGEEMAEQFAEFVNVMTHDRQEFADSVTSEHRYLQQEMFNAMLKCIENWAKAYDNDRYDARNEYAVKASYAMIEGLKKAGLY